METHSPFQSLFIISLLAFAVPIVAARLPGFRVPIVVGEILAGIAVGRSGLDLVAVDPALEFLAAFGFAYLMFLSGLEIDLDLLTARKPRLSRSVLREPLGLGLSAFVLTLAAALGAAALLHRAGLVQDPWLMALILSTTSVGIVMPSLKERRLTESQWGQSVLVAALVADFATMLLITVVAAALAGDGSLRFMLVLLLFGAFVTLYRLGSRFTRDRAVGKLMSELAHTTAQIRVRGCFALILAFVALSLQLGAEMILGAFLAGAMVALLARRESHDLRMKLDAIGFGFFIPIFFIEVGLTFDLPALLGSREALLTVPALVLAAYAVKVLPGLVFRVRFSWRDSFAAGVLLSSRLSLIIAAAAVGLRLGAIGEATNAGLILVAIVTSICSPLLFGRLRRAERTGGKAVIVVGDGPLPVALAERLAARDERVVLVGASAVEADGDRSYSRVPLGTDVAASLVAAGIRSAKALVAAADDGLNLAACGLAKREYGLGRCLALAASESTRRELNALGVETVEPASAVTLALESMVQRPSAFALLASGTSAKAAGEALLLNDGLAGQALRDSHLPGDCLVALIKRGGDLFVPTGNTVLRVGDVLTFIGERAAVAEAVELSAIRAEVAPMAEARALNSPSGSLDNWRETAYNQAATE